MVALPASLLNQWAAFERVFGPITIQERIDAAAALVSAAMRGGNPADFLVDWAKREQTAEEQIAMFKAQVGGADAS